MEILFEMGFSSYLEDNIEREIEEKTLNAPDVRSSDAAALRAPPVGSRDWMLRKLRETS